jgi:lipopolysaccharide transport system permease protein
LILIGEVQHWGEWWATFLISAAIFYGGFSVYRRLRPAFADVL